MTDSHIHRTVIAIGITLFAAPATSPSVASSWAADLAGDRTIPRITHNVNSMG